MNAYLAVLDRLRVDGPLGTLIGGSGLSTARIFPGEAPQGKSFPMVRVDTFDASPWDSKSGVATTDTDMVKVFACAPTDYECFQMSGYIRTSLDGASGVFNNLTMEHCRYLRTETYDIEVSNQGGATKHNRIRIHEHDYEVRVKVNQ